MKEKPTNYPPPCITIYKFMGLLDLPIIYTWDDTKENGTKNPRARKRKKLTDEEYFLKLDMRDNYKTLYAQGFEEEEMDY